MCVSCVRCAVKGVGGACCVLLSYLWQVLLLSLSPFTPGMVVVGLQVKMQLSLIDIRAGGVCQCHRGQFVCYGKDNDNDTLREVPHLSDEGLALQARVKGS